MDHGVEVVRARCLQPCEWGHSQLPSLTETWERIPEVFDAESPERHILDNTIVSLKRVIVGFHDRDGGQHRSYLFDKKTKQATPLIERDGMLEIPVHLFLLSESAQLIRLAFRLVGVVRVPARPLPMTFFRNCLARMPTSSFINDWDISQHALSALCTRPGRRVCL